MWTAILIGEATFRLPRDLPLGWHTLWARSEGADGVVREASCQLIVTPARLDPPALAAGRQWGLMTQVYSMRSAGLVGDRRPDGPGRPGGLERRTPRVRTSCS